MTLCAQERRGYSSVYEAGPLSRRQSLNATDSVLDTVSETEGFLRDEWDKRERVATRIG